MNTISAQRGFLQGNASLPAAGRQPEKRDLQRQERRCGRSSRGPGSAAHRAAVSHELGLHGRHSGIQPLAHHANSPPSVPAFWVSPRLRPRAEERGRAERAASPRRWVTLLWLWARLGSTCVSSNLPSDKAMHLKGCCSSAAVLLQEQHKHFPYLHIFSAQKYLPQCQSNSHTDKDLLLPCNAGNTEADKEGREGVRQKVRTNPPCPGPRERRARRGLGAATGAVTNEGVGIGVRHTQG